MFLERIKRLPLVRPTYHFLFAFIGAALCGFPSRRLFVVGVTGTKGKTTVLELMNAILEEAGKRTALLSSTAMKIGGRREKNPTENTMPGRFFIQRFLKQAAAADSQYALIEATSEGIALSRHRFVSWDAAFLINLHPEHIEAHGSFERYRAAKLAFLTYAAARGGKVFINRDDRNADFCFTALRGARVVAYSKDGLVSALAGMARAGHPAAEAASFLSADFNVENAAAAVALARDLGIDEDVILRAVRSFKGIPGRMEFVQREPFAVVVDYAHTPDSLEAVYKSLKIFHPQPSALNHRLICVFGSAGGGRDKWKRPVLGKIAAEYCDAIVITNEDPYDESPSVIMDQIEAGVGIDRRVRLRESMLLHKIVDRREAIAKAISLAKPGDAVAITGKGSEEWIHAAGGRKIPWSDARVTGEILRGKKRG